MAALKVHRPDVEGTPAPADIDQIQYYTRMPEQARLDDRLSSRDRDVFLAIIAAIRKEGAGGSTHALNRELMTVYGRIRSESSLVASIKRLIDAGYLLRSNDETLPHKPRVLSLSFGFAAPKPAVQGMLPLGPRDGETAPKISGAGYRNSGRALPKSGGVSTAIQVGPCRDSGTASLLENLNTERNTQIHAGDDGGTSGGVPPSPAEKESEMIIAPAPLQSIGDGAAAAELRELISKATSAGIDRVEASLARRKIAAGVAEGSTMPPTSLRVSGPRRSSWRTVRRP